MYTTLKFLQRGRVMIPPGTLIDGFDEEETRSLIARGVLREGAPEDPIEEPPAPSARRRRKDRRKPGISG